ncbi:NADH:flavin oxidoreductase/NADH oxidase [Dankookia sp. GCM10030260]|uniref:oxidoreductase n=1 Tax=Dankookia sp. GCM10030260 TaxID=3273390 RepID=UPI003607B90D
MFDPSALTEVTLRNRIAISPVTQYSCSPDGVVTDWHLAHLGAGAMGGAGLVRVEQLAVSPEGRMTPGGAALWNDDQAEALARVTRFLKARCPASSSAIPAAKAAFTSCGMATPSSRPTTRRAGSPSPPSASPLVAASRAPRGHDAGFVWLEIRYAQGFLGASFLSPIADGRVDEHGGTAENRARFLVAAFRAVRAAWPERLLLIVRMGAIDFHSDTHTVQDSIALVEALAVRGLDRVDISLGMNINAAEVPWTECGFMVPTASRIQRETGMPVAVSWNLGAPVAADRLIRDEGAGLLMVGRPALANPP